MKKYIGLFIFVLALALTLVKPPEKTEAISLTTAKDTLSSSRLSVHGRVDGTGTAVGSTTVKMLASASTDSNSHQANTISTANLRTGDSVLIGTGTYTVAGVTDATTFTVTSLILAGDATNNVPIYFNSKPTHTITFNTPSAIANGFFQILLPADTTASASNDGKADDAGYDFNTTPTVTGTDVGSTYDFVTGVATVSGATGCTAPSGYHCFEAHYSGTGVIGQAISIAITNVISPAAKTGHTEAIADTYIVPIKQFAASANPNSASPIDNSVIDLAHIEAVRVTATVDPTIDLTIGAVAAGTKCGVSTVTSTALAVPFGTMALNTFKNSAHSLTVSTNAASGYVVTAAENDQLGKNGGTSPFIIDALGNGGAMTHTAEARWDTATFSGFAYSIENSSAASVPFEYSTVSGNCSGGTFCAREYADLQASEVPQTVMSSTTVANAELAYICYRLSVSATQAAGDYENQIIYTATGTF